MDEVTASQVSEASLQNQLIANQHRLAPLLQPRETLELRVRIYFLVDGYIARTCLCQNLRDSIWLPKRTLNHQCELHHAIAVKSARAGLSELTLGQNILLNI
jgi:hypothetical protein